MTIGRLIPLAWPNIARLAQIRGPEEPGLMSPAFDLAFLNWLRARKAGGTAIPKVELQTISSIFGASEKWSIIPATNILVEGLCSTVDVSAADPSSAGFYIPLGEAVHPSCLHSPPSVFTQEPPLQTLAYIGEDDEKME